MMNEEERSADQHVDAQSGGTVFNQYSGTQLNQVSHNYYGPGASPDMGAEDLYRYGLLKLSTGEVADGQHLLLKAVEAGHVGAMWDLFQFYWSSANFEAGKTMARLAAQARHPEACYLLAKWSSGEEKIEFYRQAHELGHEKAAQSLGEYHLNRALGDESVKGETVGVDRGEEFRNAIFWLEKAVEGEGTSVSLARIQLSNAKSRLATFEKKKARRLAREERKSGRRRPFWG